MSLIRLAITIFIVYLIYRALMVIITGVKKEIKGSTGAQSVNSGGEDLVEDPFCHTFLPVSNAYKASFEGKTLYFCCRKCFKSYMKDRTG